VALAERIGHEAGIDTSAVGMITTGTQAEEILASGNVQAVMVARAAMRNPHWPMMAAEELGDVIEWAPQLERGRTVAKR